METWENNLNSLLGQHGSQFLQNYNTQLYTFCKEWVGAVSEKNGYSANLTRLVQNNQKVLCIKATMRGMYTSEFICHLYYSVNQDGEVILNVKSVKSFDYNAHFLAIPTDQLEQFYTWSEDEISGIEIFEKGFVLETINIAFENYLSFLKSKNRLFAF